MIVADASPLIALDRIGLIEILPALYENAVIIPPAVAAEVLRSNHVFRSGQPAWLVERAPQDSLLVESLKARLDPGESEAIALALELGSNLLIDERAGRRLASLMGIKIVGTAGALLDAKRYSLIPSLAGALKELQAVDFRLDTQIVDEVLRAAGESKL